MNNKKPHICNLQAPVIAVYFMLFGAYESHFVDKFLIYLFFDGEPGALVACFSQLLIQLCSNDSLGKSLSALCH